MDVFLGNGFGSRVPRTRCPEIICPLFVSLVHRPPDGTDCILLRPCLGLPTDMLCHLTLPGDLIVAVVGLEWSVSGRHHMRAQAVSAMTKNVRGKRVMALSLHMMQQ